MGAQQSSVSSDPIGSLRAEIATISQDSILREIKFSSPLQWTTRLQPETLLEYVDDDNVSFAWNDDESEIVDVGTSLCVLSMCQRRLSACTFHSLHLLLSLLPDDGLSELRVCLRENHDIPSAVLGPAVARRLYDTTTLSIESSWCERLEPSERMVSVIQRLMDVANDNVKKENFVDAKAPPASAPRRGSTKKHRRGSSKREGSSRSSISSIDIASSVSPPTIALSTSPVRPSSSVSSTRRPSSSSVSSTRRPSSSASSTRRTHKRLNSFDGSLQRIDSSPSRHERLPSAAATTSKSDHTRLRRLTSFDSLPVGHSTSLARLGSATSGVRPLSREPLFQGASFAVTVVQDDDSNSERDINKNGNIIDEGDLMDEMMSMEIYNDDDGDDDDDGHGRQIPSQQRQLSPLTHVATSNSLTTAEYWHIERILLVLKRGNETATVLALSLLNSTIRRDNNKKRRESALAVCEAGGLEVIINLLDSDNVRCVHGALQMLLAMSPFVRVEFAQYDMLYSLTRLIGGARDDSHDNSAVVQTLAATLMADMVKLARHRRVFEHLPGAFERLVKQLSLSGNSELGETLLQRRSALVRRRSSSSSISSNPPLPLYSAASLPFAVARVLWQCSHYTPNAQAMYNVGVLRRLALVLHQLRASQRVTDQALWEPLVGLASELARRDARTRRPMRTLGVVELFVPLLEMPRLRVLAARAIGQCALRDLEVRQLVCARGCVSILTRWLIHEDHTANADHGHDHHGTTLEAKNLADCAIALWGCLKANADDAAVAVALETRCDDMNSDDANGTLLKVVSARLLGRSSDRLRVAVTGILVEVLAVQRIRTVVRESEVICSALAAIAEQLKSTHLLLLVNTLRAVELMCEGDDAKSNDTGATLLKHDTLRYAFSLLKHPHDAVVAQAAWTMAALLRAINVKTGAEELRSFLGGLDLVVGVLAKSSCDSVLAGVCAVIAQIARDPENLAVLTDHGAVAHLAALTQRRLADIPSLLRQHLSSAIATCCRLQEENSTRFGSLGVAWTLIDFLRRPERDEAVHTAVAQALEGLSHNHTNCSVLYEADMVHLLLRLCAAPAEETAFAAAGCLRNVRMFVMNS